MSIFNEEQQEQSIKRPQPNDKRSKLIEVATISEHAKSVTILGRQLTWFNQRDPRGTELFRSHPGYGKDVRLPYYVMKFWMEFLETKEIAGKQHNPLIVWFFKTFTWLGSKYWTDETAWCKASWNAACETAGFRVGDSALAADGMKEGQEIPAEEVQHGDFVILSHLDSKGRFNGRHHITFWEKFTSESIYGLGGNQSNRINISAWSLREIKPGHIRRLTRKQSMLPDVARRG